ncbi:NAD-dependent malic enzyme [Salsipaludibacter albus]|uniref:NAD-dependent malic enzyme n=1 Tax=Salsipaludibacter albus TaxID=2849650 RepID=UPI001EE447A8|nr:NAD-dependent malic enzyme [Salsipaludibacter albus]MBY5162811.1 NAD-dependent malic enzyme [Salsipaludibacter albus]
MPPPQQTVTYSLAVQNLPGMLTRVTEVIDRHEAVIVGSERTDAQRHVIIRAISVEVADDAGAAALGADLQDLDGVEVLGISDDVTEAHLGGKIELHNRRPVETAHDLSLVYTPGVAKICRAIAADPVEAYRLTIKSNAVAVVTDGSAVLGLGDIGPLASLPVMEGKAMLLKSFGDVDAYPLLVDEQDPDTFVDTVVRVASGFGGINLEDISAPRCFEIEGKLRRRLDIPVFHDDQHGTAVVALAALVNAARVVDKDLADLRVVVQGIGAAGVAIANLLAAAGVTDLVGVDRDGIIEPKRKQGMDPIRRRLAKQSNPRGLRGDQGVALDGADVFIGVSGPESLPLENVARMARDPIVFAMANPVPELHPDLAEGHVAVMATGRSDFPNQINNVLCFPGIFRGLLDAAATKVTDRMKIAAAEAIAGIVGDDLAADHVVPSPFDRTVAPAVAGAVADVARAEGHVRPGSRGSLEEEAAAAAHSAARRALS